MDAEKRGLDILDFFLIVAKAKKILLILVSTVFIISYIAIYLFIPSQYDSTALIIPSQQEQFGGISSLLKNVGNLPMGIGNISQNNDIEMYKTIIYSSTNLNKVIKKFDLLKDYDLTSIEKAKKILTKNITADETDENAFLIKVRASSPQKAAEMTNYLVDQLNESVINLNVRKARDNRIFLGERYNEIKDNLKNAEDSLRFFQEKSGILEVENQTKATIEEYSKMESELATKQIELSVLKEIMGEDAPQVKNQTIAVREFKKSLENLQSGKKNNPLLISLNSLPDKAVKYLRYYRDVKIYSSMLEFIIPLYEQAKFDEQKEIPILQVIDYGVPPEKKSYPSRVLFSFIITISSILFFVLYNIIKEILQKSTDAKIDLIKKELKIFKSKEQK